MVNAEVLVSFSIKKFKLCVERFLVVSILSLGINTSINTFFLY